MKMLTSAVLVAALALTGCAAESNKTGDPEAVIEDPASTSGFPAINSSASQNYDRWLDRELAYLDPANPPCSDAGAATVRDVIDPVTGAGTVEISWPRVFCMTPTEIAQRNEEIGQIREDRFAELLDPTDPPCMRLLYSEIRDVIDPATGATTQVESSPPDSDAVKCMSAAGVDERNRQISSARERYGMVVTPR